MLHDPEGSAINSLRAVLSHPCVADASCTNTTTGPRRTAWCAHFVSASTRPGVCGPRQPTFVVTPSIRSSSFATCRCGPVRVPAGVGSGLAVAGTASR